MISGDQFQHLLVLDT